MRILRKGMTEEPLPPAPAAGEEEQDAPFDTPDRPLGSWRATAIIRPPAETSMEDELNPHLMSGWRPN
jgi:hypothetical protein